MFEVSAEPEKSIIVVRSSGIIQAEDYEESTLELDRLIAETNPTGLLLDCAELEGWADEGAESMRFFYRLKYRSKFQRIAVLADMKWNAAITDFEELTRVPTRRFAPTDRQSAEAWLTSPT